MERLREYINERLGQEGASIRQLAREAGLSHTTVYDVLAGRTKPGLRFYQRVATALGVSVDYLLDLAGETPAGAREDDSLMEIMAIARHLSPEQVRALRDYARWQSALERARHRDGRRQAPGAG
jgi:gp16 family phage-associated protein